MDLTALNFHFSHGKSVGVWEFGEGSYGYFKVFVVKVATDLKEGELKGKTVDNCLVLHLFKLILS